MESIRFGILVVAGALVLGAVHTDVSALPVADSQAIRERLIEVDHFNQLDDGSDGMSSSRTYESSTKTQVYLIDANAELSHELGASGNSIRLGRSDVTRVREPGSLALIGLGLLALLVLGRVGRKR